MRNLVERPALVAMGLAVLLVLAGCGAKSRQKSAPVAALPPTVVLETKRRPLPEVVDAETTAIIASLVRARGTADAQDVAVVARELTYLPIETLRLVQGLGIVVSVCRNNVTDYLPEYKGLKPGGGYSPEATYEDVPAFALDGLNEAVISVSRNPATGAITIGGVSASTVLHEVAHLIDFDLGLLSGLDDFREPREADLKTLDDYFKQEGEAGRRETFAESFAGFYADLNDEALHPNLHAYWAKQPLRY